MRTAAAKTSPLDAGIDTGIVAAARVTATVNPAPAAASATVDTGFADLDGTLGPVQQAAPTVNTVADTGEPEDADLDARVAALLPK
jgi:hypothetical protein